jgi:hypothetical protein
MLTLVSAVEKFFMLLPIGTFFYLMDASLAFYSLARC